MKCSLCHVSRRRSSRFGLDGRRTAPLELSPDTELVSWPHASLSAIVVSMSQPSPALIDFPFESLRALPQPAAAASVSAFHELQTCVVCHDRGTRADLRRGAVHAAKSSS